MFIQRIHELLGFSNQNTKKCEEGFVNQSLQLPRITISNLFSFLFSFRELLLLDAVIAVIERKHLSGEGDLTVLELCVMLVAYV